MHLGLALPQLGPLCDAPRIADFARTAEQLGYASLWVGDRALTPVRPHDPYPGARQPYPPEHTKVLDPIVTLTVAATATRSVRLGSSTLNAPWYSPVLLGRALTSLDLVSSGRLDVGIGLGWMRDEYQAVGVDWAERGARLEEILDVWEILWTQELGEYVGEFFTLPRSVMDLHPAQPGGPPVLLAGSSPRALERIGRRGAGWLALSALPAPLTARLWDVARLAAEQAGRDPEALRRVLRVNPPPGSNDDDVARAVAAAFGTGTAEVFVDLTYCSRGVDDALDRAATLIAGVGPGAEAEPDGETELRSGQPGDREA
jgi:probable F420-dependent oxidoreductase